MKHISECITEWFDDYEREHMTDPFNLPDALTAIRDEYTPPSEPRDQPSTESETQA